MIDFDLFMGKMIDVGKNERKKKVKSNYYEMSLKFAKNFLTSIFIVDYFIIRNL